MSGRVPPYSEEAEKAALGSMLMDAVRVMPLAMNLKIKPVAFYVPAHAEIFEAALGLHTAGKPVDVLTVEEDLKHTGKLEKVGGSQYLQGLVDATPTSAHAEYYLNIIRQKGLLRAEISLHTELIGECFQEEDGDSHVRQVPARFAEIIEGVTREVSNIETMNKLVDRWREAKLHNKPAIGLTLPWTKLTELLCGLETGVTILAGRPSQGKTTIEDEVSVWNAADGIPVARVTLDSSRDELLGRTLCRKAGVSLPKLKFGFAGESQLAKIEEVKEVIADYPMWINDTDRDWRSICTWARLMKAKHDIQLLTVDYLQLISAPEMGRSEWDANARITYVSGQLKKLSFELGIPVLVLSQLNRAVEKDGREPKLSDLRDSGAIEQDASKVLFVYRDEDKVKEMEKNDPKATKHRRPMWVDVLKHKDGVTGKLPYWMYPPYFRFVEIGGVDFEETTDQEEGLYATLGDDESD
jgi:replicative DNA helicase